MSATRKYFAILKAELEDLEDDLELLLEVSGDKLASGELSNYVYKNNSAVFRKELAGVAEIIRELDSLPTSELVDAADAEDRLLAEFAKTAKNYDFPEAVLGLLKRKMQKVRQYLCID